MTWVLVLIVAWVAVAVVVALVIGRTVHTADVLEHTDEPAAADPDREHDHEHENRDGGAPPPAGAAGFVVPRPRGAFAER